MAINVSDFPVFFRELNGRDAFPWQTRLAESVCMREWPAVIDLPTASGKTACIDIALFALACKDHAPRRIFFVVDRRIVVNEAFSRTRKTAAKLRDASEGILFHVAVRLRALAGDGDADPVEVCELRGGIYREESWIRTPLQPTVVTSTVDQVGSRLLFRGYGVPQQAWPIHAAMVANDSLIFLDEAHCSRAFAETLSSVRKFREWAIESAETPFRTVEMTSTPAVSTLADRFEIGPDDRLDEVLAKRLFASKPTRLIQIKSRAEDLDRVAESCCTEAIALSEATPAARRIAVMVNRVYTARAAFARLRAEGQKVRLLIGRMRPLDRDDLMSELEPLRSDAVRSLDDEKVFVVATQCVEVGADLDFDLLVSECASMDALQQRFGRLNRLGDFVEARGSIVASASQMDANRPDPVYGDALSHTWKWLHEIAERGEVNMGIESHPNRPATVNERFKTLDEQHLAAMRTPGRPAPVLLPAHLDAWVQTKPRPSCEPLVRTFLHGQDSQEPDIQVIWRADLDAFETRLWADLVSLCPPTAPEAMPVPIAAFRRWYARQGGEKKIPMLRVRVQSSLIRRG